MPQLSGNEPILGLNIEGNDLLIVFVYVDDIIFGSNKDSLVQWFSFSM
jgi:hypothetical protein